MADQKRDVELRIKATEDTGPASRASVQNIEKVEAALARQAATAVRSAETAMKAYSQTSKALEDAQKQAVDARRTYDDFANSLAGTSEPTKKQVREFENLAKAADTADRQVAGLADKLAKQESRFNDQTNRAASIDAEITAIRERAAAEDAAYKKTEQASLRHAAALEEAMRQQQELARLDAFRKVGADARASIDDLDAFTIASKSAGAGGATLASDLRSLLDPAAQARNTLAGLEAESERLATAIGDGTRPLRELQDEIYDLGRAQQTIVKQAGFIDAYRNQQTVVNQSADTYERLRAEVIRLSTAIQQADAPNEGLISDLRRAETAAENAATALDRERNTLAKLKQPLDAAGISTDNLTKSEKRLEAAARTTATALDTLNKQQAGQTSKVGAFLGLRPYELTNLSYQVNDIITQLASGTPVFQIIGQQGGQIAQLFPKLLQGALAILPELLAVGAALGTVALGVNRLIQNEAMVRQFNAQLTLNSDGLKYNSDTLAANARELERYGIKLEDARKAVSLFVQQGVDASQIVAYGRAAKNLADIVGIDLTDAQTKVAKAFQGGYEQVKELDDAYNFLTATQRDQIQAQYDSGDAAGASEKAFKILYDLLEDGAQKQKGPWKTATQEFGKAWSDFLDGLGKNDSIRLIKYELEGLINTVTAALKLLRGTDVKEVARSPNPNAPSVVPQALRPQTFMDKLRTGDWWGIQRNFQRDEFQADLAKRVGAIGRPSDSEKQAEADRKVRDDTIRKLGEQRVATEKLSKAERQRVAGLKAVREAEEKGLHDRGFLEEIRKAAEETEGWKADRDAARAARSQSAKDRAAENRLKAEQNARDALERTILSSEASMEAKIGRQQKTDLVSRLKAVDDTYSKIYADIARFQAKGGTSLGGMSVDDFKKQVDANKDILKQQEQLAYYEDTLKAKTDERKAALQSVSDEYAAGQITATAAFAKIQDIEGQLGPGIKQLADDAIKFAEALNATSPTPELRAFIAQMKTVSKAQGQRGTPNDPLRDSAKQLLSGEEGKLNNLLQQRAALLGVLKEQYDAGLISLGEYRDKTMAAFDGTKPAILGAAADFQKILDTVKAIISPELYETWKAKLELIKQGTQAVDENFVNIRTQLEQTFTGGIVNMVGTLGDAIGGLIDGTMSWGNAIRSVWDGFRAFAADFLRQIAQMIVQQAVLNALKGAASSGKGGFFASIAKAVVGATTGTTTKHTGGLGGSGPQKSLPSILFANAPYYHEGRSFDLGLNSDEQTAIIKKNEEVLTEENPRHIKNWGKGGSSSGPPIVNLKNVNVFDPVEVLRQALSTKEGETVVMNTLRDNGTTVKQIAGGN